LIILPNTIVLEEAPFDLELIHRIISKIDYTALKGAHSQISAMCLAANIDLPTLPDTISPRILNQSETHSVDNNCSNDDYEDADIDAMKNIFRALFEIHIIEGILVCPDTGREFPIKEGIPNMILHEDEL
jgi:uncharacterized protein YbaR (Trm112 family)